jgi:glycosyltransferase involved in cell wall biosynthesis
MRPLQRVAFIGNHLPRRCGIATFTHDVHAAVVAAHPEMETGVVAMTDSGHTYDYPPAVRFHVNDGSIDEYVQAARFLNESRFEVVCLQHEYGIFGGEAGAHIIELLSRLDMPVVSTLHTVLSEPTPAQRRVMERIIDISAKVVVMSEKGRDFLMSAHGVPVRKIEVVPHGIPSFPFLETDQAKTKFGFSDKSIILTFGLLSPSKGIETVIDAMPQIIRSCPNALYVVLGATHPNLVRHHGEAYRESLMARVRELGIEDNVAFFNQFVEQGTLLEFISMCDVYATPYLNEAQMTSGTLAYSFGLGKSVVSTPYWHAQELLSDGRGVLVPFGDVRAMGTEIADLLTDDVRRNAMRKRAYEASRSMTWPQTAIHYVSIFEAAQTGIQRKVLMPIQHFPPWRTGPSVPELRIAHFLSLCDSTGILQHAVHSVPDRAHGYCVDDNARALLLSCALANSDQVNLPDGMTARFAAFIQHAWNPDTGRFRNFMSFDRRWLEPSGSEDSHGRTLWALGECARADTDPSRRRWAAALFKTALGAVESFRSPRAWAFTLLGLHAFCARDETDADANKMRRGLAERLMTILSATEAPDWVWFEGVLAYDNARLPQALIQTGVATDMPVYVDAGLRSLRWLIKLQTAPSGVFRPIGTQSFGAVRQKPWPFDQQPVEAWATISACLAAWQTGGATEWAAETMRAFRWFLGENDLQTTLIDADTGSCSDGLHPDRVNENKGAESVLAYLMGLVEIGQLVRSVAAAPTKSPPRPAHSIFQAASLPKIAGGSVVSIAVPKSSGVVSSARPDQGRRETVQAGDGAARLQPDR